MFGRERLSSVGFLRGIAAFLTPLMLAALTRLIGAGSNKFSAQLSSRWRQVLVQ